MNHNCHITLENSNIIVTVVFVISCGSSSGATAVTDVCYSAAVNDGKEKHNKGIVSYNKDMLVYVAFEFDQDRITDEQLEGVAKSIEIKR